MLSTVTEFSPLTSGFAGEITSAAGKLWFTVQSPNAIGMLDPADPTHTPHLYSTGIGGTPVDITTGPDGNVWFTEPTNHAIGMINTTNPSHPITIYNSADGLAANAEPQGITSGKDATGKSVLWFTDTITNASLGSLGRIDPADPTHIPAESPIPSGKIGFYKYNNSKITEDPTTGSLWFSEAQLDVNSNPVKSGIGRYNPKSNTWSEWALPSGAGQQPLSLLIDGGNLWFSEIVVNSAHVVTSSAIGVVAPGNTPALSEVTIPGGAVPNPQRITIAPDGMLWFTDQGNAAMGSYNPLTQAFTSLPIQKSGATKALPLGITTGPDGNVWFTDTDTSGHSYLGAVSHATHIVIPGPWEPPTAVQAGKPFSVTAVAADSFGNPDPGYSGTATLSLAPSGSVDGTSSAAASGGFFVFPAVIVSNSGTGYTLGLTAPGLTPPATTTKFDVTGNSNNAATKLVVAVEPLSSVTAGSGFGVIVYAENAAGMVDPNFNGTLSMSVNTGPPGSVLSGPTTATASAGVALFPGLSLNTPGTGYTLLIASPGLTSTVTTPFNVTGSVPPPAPVAPVIIGETPLFTQRHNKKGKPIGRRVLTGFELEFSEPMNTGTAGNSGNYVVDAYVLQRVKRKRITVLQPVGFTASMVSSTSVQLLTGSQKFSKGGKLILSTSPPGGISSATGALLDSSYGTFTILAGGSGLTRP